MFEPTKLWLSEHGYSCCDVLYIGDALTDYKAAKEANFQFMGTCTGLLSSEDFKKFGVNSLYLASAADYSWKPKFVLKSPNYTSNIEEIISV